MGVNSTPPNTVGMVPVSALTAECRIDNILVKLEIKFREAFKKKKTPKFGTLSESGRGGLKNHKLFFQNLVWTFFNRGGGFCHHVQTVKS